MVNAAPFTRFSPCINPDEDAVAVIINCKEAVENIESGGVAVNNNCEDAAENSESGGVAVNNYCEVVAVNNNCEDVVDNTESGGVAVKNNCEDAADSESGGVAVNNNCEDAADSVSGGVAVNNNCEDAVAVIINCEEAVDNIESGGVVVNNNCEDAAENSEFGGVAVNNYCEDVVDNTESGGVAVNNNCEDAEINVMSGGVAVNNNCVNAAVNSESGGVAVNNNCKDAAVNNGNIQCGDVRNGIGKKKVKGIRRAGMNKRLTKNIKIMYSNIQGFTGKKSSITDIFHSIDCDVCMLVETMTTRVKIEGGRSICPNKSVGQNVAIVLGSRLSGCPTMKLFDPNDDINMLGIRIEVAKNNCLRLYTAHLKQISTNDKDVIRTQFEEIRCQFNNAAICREGMILMCDANVHVGGAGIPLSHDKQDWAGAELLELIHEEGLFLVNGMDKCRGVVTRIDPRNGTETKTWLYV